MNVCRHCLTNLTHQPEKALNGEVELVWTSVQTKEWVCGVTNDEHDPIDMTFFSVNEEGEVYGQPKSLTEAVATLEEFPNDHIVLTFTSSPVTEMLKNMELT